MMEEFLSLNWRITGPHELEHGPDFIPEEEIEKSYIFSNLRDKFLKKGETGVNTSKPISVTVQKQYPGKSYRLKCEQKSFLTIDEQSKCLSALQILQSGKKGLSPLDKAYIELYNNVQQQIIAENANYQEFARKRFLAKKTEGGYSNHYKTYADQIFGVQLKRCKDYVQFYKEIDMLSYSYAEDHTPIEMHHLKCLLELGSLAKFSKPTLIKPFFISPNKMQNVFETYNSNLPVSKDVNALNLAQNEDVDVVISSSALKRLLNFTETNCKWDIPILVKQIPTRKPDGSQGTKTVVFIDKPLPNKNPTTMEITAKCIKRGLKGKPASLRDIEHPDWVPCQNMGYEVGIYLKNTEALDCRYENVESPLSIVYNDPLQIATRKTRKRKIATNLNMVVNGEKQESKSPKVTISDNEEHQSKMLKHDCSIENVITDPTVTKENDLNLGASQQNQNLPNSPLLEKEEEPNPEKPASISENVNTDSNLENELSAKKNPVKPHHNASYRLWNLGQVADPDQSKLMKQRYGVKDIKVMVRCKLDACELVNNSILQPLVIHPKIEYQPEFGGSLPSKAEIVKQWASLYFRPYSQLYRVRLTPITKEVLMVENCTMEKIKNEAQIYHKYKPSLGLGVLYKIFLELTKLSQGSYMLHHLPKHGAFVALLESTVEDKSTYNLYDEYDMRKWQIISKFDKVWCPIDVNLVLPRHSALEQMPGMFPPLLKRKPVANVFRKGKKKKGKKKKKLLHTSASKNGGNAS